MLGGMEVDIMEDQNNTGYVECHRLGVWHSHVTVLTSACDMHIVLCYSVLAKTFPNSLTTPTY